MNKTVITILAEPPPGWQGAPLNWDGNQTIEIAETTVLPKADIQMRASVTDTCVTKAGLVRCGLRDRFEDIQKLKLDRPCIVQILGHGRPGQLGLGYYWNSLYQGGFDSEFYSLDGNPRGYWKLGIWHLPDDCEIWLLGCSVGQTSHYDAAGDGDALMYDLTHLLKRPVKAAATEIHIQADFDNRGLFTGALLEAGQPVRNATLLKRALSASRETSTPVANPPRVTFVTGVATTSSAPKELRRLRIPVADLALRFPREILNPALTLPLPDLDVLVDLDEDLNLWGQIYANGRYLRVKVGDSHRHMRTFARSPMILDDDALRVRILSHLAEDPVAL